MGYSRVEAEWPYSYYVNFWIKQSKFEHGQENCVEFLDKKTLYSQNASLHPGVQMGTSEFNAGGNPSMN